MSSEPIAQMRPLRADAARNRVRILEAARTAFAESGLDVGVEEIARRAGVGKGTLYRRFPTKEALVRAIFEDLLDDIDRIVEESNAEPDPEAAFSRFLHDAAFAQISNQGFFDVITQRLGSRAVTPEQRARFLHSINRPLLRAQAAGAVRDDLVAEDVSILLRMLGVTTRPATDGSPMNDHWPRYLGLLADALRPSAATQLPAEPLRFG